MICCEARAALSSHSVVVTGRTSASGCSTAQRRGKCKKFFSTRRALFMYLLLPYLLFTLAPFSFLLSPRLCLRLPFLRAIKPEKKTTDMQRGAAIRRWRGDRSATYFLSAGHRLFHSRFGIKVRRFTEHRFYRFPFEPRRNITTLYSLF